MGSPEEKQNAPTLMVTLQEKKCPTLGGVSGKKYASISMVLILGDFLSLVWTVSKINGVPMWGAEK